MSVGVPITVILYRCLTMAVGKATAVSKNDNKKKVIPAPPPAVGQGRKKEETFCLRGVVLNRCPVVMALVVLVIIGLKLPLNLSSGR